MQSFDIVIVGGGPAGSSCAWALRDAGLAVAILDRARFPRNKICGGWITPPVFTALRIDPVEYGRGRTMQPITGFRTSIPGGRELETDYGAVVSYGIRRCEFDHFLLARSHAQLFEDVEVQSIRRAGVWWVIDDRFRARLLVGAGGHFCPVARMLGAHPARESAVLAQEAEFEMPPAGASLCPIRGETPELYFCPDMKGYGWCFRKGDYLNVGLGRLDPHELAAHVARFLEFLSVSGKTPFPLPGKLRGHAYLLYRTSPRTVAAEGVMLAGDAAGLACSQSGEGIRPAVESGLLASHCILSAKRDCGAASLAYRDLLRQRFGVPHPDWVTRMARRLPPPALRFAARHAVNHPAFARAVILDRWFLHRR